mgnify:CR=1 FL=1
MGRHLVTVGQRSSLQLPLGQWFESGVLRSSHLVTQRLVCAPVSSTLDVVFATRELVGRFRTHGTGSRSPVCSATAAGCQPCWPCGMEAGDRTSGGGCSGSLAGTTLCSASTPADRSWTPQRLRLARVARQSQEHHYTQRRRKRNGRREEDFCVKLFEQNGSRRRRGGELHRHLHATFKAPAASAC